MGYRYIGSKDKLSSKLIDKIKEIKPDAKTIIDLMAGTGLFSLALRKSGYIVNAADVMTYSFHHLNVNLLINEVPLFKGLENEINFDESFNTSLFGNSNYSKVIQSLNSLIGIEGYFYREFSPSGIPPNAVKTRKYFTVENAKKIDSVRKKIKEWNSKKMISKCEYSLLLHDLIMAVNDIANIAGTYGHYLSKFTKRSKDPIELRSSNLCILDFHKKHKVHLGYAEDLSKKLKGDICYIDPPYIKRQYAANYHILETIARGDEPEAIGESGLRPWRDQYSNFCSKVKIRDSFSTILNNISTSDFLISYSEDGLLSKDELIDFLSDFGVVSFDKIQYKRFKSNNSKKAESLFEYLIHVHTD